VGEETALGHPEILGEPPDREPLESDPRRQAQRVRQDRLARLCALGRGPRPRRAPAHRCHGIKIVRPFGSVKGLSGVEPPAPVKRIMEIVDQAKTVAPEQQAELAQELFRIWVDNLWKVGTIGLTSMVQGVGMANTKFRNIAHDPGQRRAAPGPGNARVEQFLFAR